MGVDGLRRPLFLSLACAASLTLIYAVYLTYQSDDQTSGKSPLQSLHRSNAVRRPRRYHAANERPIDSVLRGLQTAATADQELARYQNSTLSLGGGADLGISLGLKLSKLSEIARALTYRHPEWSSRQREDLKLHVEASYVYFLLVLYWPQDEPITPEDRTELTQHLDVFDIQKRAAALGIDAYSLKAPIDLEFRLDIPHDRALPIPTDGAADDYTLLADEEQENEVDEAVGLDDLDDTSGSQNMLNLLYNIAGEQAKKDGFIHRGVECNSCGACPIQGIRYHCANCFDYDLCETCESNQVHTKTHVFYKIRVPAPSRGQIKQVLPKWYPGNSNAFPQNLSKATMDHLLEATGMDRTEVGALYGQFKCLAGHEYPTDPCELGMAIDRKGFDFYFIPTGSDKPQPANLIYDRIFSFYDGNGDGLIGFEEFLTGLSNLQDKSRMAKLRRIFQGYDLDGDGFVCRRDFLRMFRAYYDLSQQLNREMIANQEDFGYLDEEIREVVHGSQPISAAFGGNVLQGHQSRAGQDKQAAPNGDLVFSNGSHDILRDEHVVGADRARAIGNAALGHAPKIHLNRPFRVSPPRDDPLMYISATVEPVIRQLSEDDDATSEQLAGPEPPLQVYSWPPHEDLEPGDVVAAMGGDVPVEEITDPTDRARTLYNQSLRLDREEDRMLGAIRANAVNERWRRRQFYLDEEEGFTKPQGYTEPDSSDDEESEDVEQEQKTHSRRQSLRSRSSSKVRFDDSAIDTDHETRSNASSRSVPQNERWGGFELSQPEMDIGRDILYAAVQQGFNELLDGLFRRREEEAIEAAKTLRDRKKWADVLQEYEDRQAQMAVDKAEVLMEADRLRTEELFSGVSPPISQHIPTEETDAIGQGIDDAAATKAPSDSSISATGLSSAQLPEIPSKDLADTTEEALRDPALMSEPDFDPTLPQFRPNSPSVEPNTSVTKSRGPRPSQETLGTWSIHKATEYLATIRGGPGRLDFSEFRVAMRSENEKDMRTELQVQEDDTAYWEKGSDLGRMAFVGTWLEMASF